MKRFIIFLLIFFLTGCATTYTLDVKDYAMPVPSYPLKLLVYYKPSVKGNQFLEGEYTQYGTKQKGYYRILYGQIITKKFDSAFARMFEEAERSYVADLKTRFLELKSKKLDLLCDTAKVTQVFKFDKRKKFDKTLVKKIHAEHSPYIGKTDIEIKVSFYLPDGSVLNQKTYAYGIAEPMFKGSFKAVLDMSNGQFSRGVDEILTEAIKDLTGSEKFKQLIK